MTFDLYPNDENHLDPSGSGGQKCKMDKMIMGPASKISGTLPKQNPLDEGPMFLVHFILAVAVVDRVSFFSTMS